MSSIPPSSPPPLPPHYPTTPHAFTTLVNSRLSHLSTLHTTYLTTPDDENLLLTARHAALLRRAAIVYTAVSDILPTISNRDDPTSTRLASYLRGLSDRLSHALHHSHYPNLLTLVDAAQAVLDQLDASVNLFHRLSISPLSADSKHSAPSVTTPLSDDDQAQQATSIAEWPDSPADELRHSAHDADRVRCRPCTLCGIACSDLSARDRLIIWLYVFMVLGAFIAVTAVTVDFVRQLIDPGSFIRSSEPSKLSAPVVTICLSQEGVPASRLQLFNFTDAEGRLFRGADPTGSHDQRQSPEFGETVERFWDNPLGEDCDAKVGDYYPFPVQSLNRLISGEDTTQCRPCFRVGSKREALVQSTDFRNSSVLELYTDDYFLQCIKSRVGLTADSLERLHQTVLNNSVKMEELGVLDSTVPDQPVRSLSIDKIRLIDTTQCCNIFYFGYFPKLLNRSTGGVDIRYSWDGNQWNPAGNGPYLNLKFDSKLDILPEESLQMFVSTNRSTTPGQLSKNRDMILIGPNTQTFATFRPIVVYDVDRYDISSSTSNLRDDDVIALFGYWLVYRIYYNYNRFVVDEWYRESTYPASQWIVDVTGYASLFTGASLFSLLLLPLLRAVRRREKQALLKQKPEAYLWSRHKQRYEESQGAAKSKGDLDTRGLKNGSSVVLPGYNV